MTLVSPRLSLGLLCLCGMVCQTAVAGGIDHVSAGVPSDVPRMVGYVEQLSGDLASFALERAGKAVPLQLLMPVQAGDRVVVRGPGNRVLFRCANRRLTVTETDSPFVIPPAPSPPGFLMRLGTLLLDLGSRLMAQQTRTVTKTSTSTRGDEGPLGIPMLEGGSSRLANDLTRWSLAWRGGEPPYAVRLETTEATPRELFKAEGIESPRIVVPAPGGDFSGFVRLSVVDHAGETVEANVEIVPAEHLPSSDEPIRQAEVPAQLHALLEADFLIKEDAKRWSFQAYQSVAGLADSFEPARWLRDCLEEEAWCYRQ
jgi:hypothetical protein